MKDRGCSNKGTFLIKIFSEQNDTLHGKILHADENKEYFFRSTEEMLYMIESSLEKEE